jgi:hypothetical protein
MQSEQEDKPLLWLHGKIHTPPFSRAARIEAGELLRLLQGGVLLRMPESRRAGGSSIASTSTRSSSCTCFRNSRSARRFK